MCKKYRLQAKRPSDKDFSDWLSTDDYEVVKRNIKTINSLGWKWKLNEGVSTDEEDHSTMLG